MKNASQHPAGTAVNGEKKASRYIPALDGLRALSVLVVIAYHMGLGWAPGGLMGVTVFFVISGYLINGLLVAEHERTGKISLARFWLRRVRRILPAVVLAIVGTAALCTLFDHVLFDKLRSDALPSLLFYNNWWQIFRDVSYFEAAGSPSPLTHYWSLSIEEQFYLVWPLLLLLMYRMGMRKRGMAAVVFVLAVLSAVEMGLLYDPLGDPSRVYYGTDTRAMSLLIGVWLAFVWPSSAFGANAKEFSGGKGLSIVLSVLGTLSLAGIVAIVGFTNGYSSFSYYGGIAMTTLLAAALIVVLTVPDTWMAKLFGLTPFAWIGKRSYSMYLWHYPIILLTTDVNSTTGTPWWMHIVQLALIIAVSALSYTFVENPIRRGLRDKNGVMKGAPDGPSAKRSLTIGRVMGRIVAPAGCFAALLVVAGVGVASIPPVDYDSLYVRPVTAAAASEAEPDSAAAGQSDENADSGQSAGSADPEGSEGEELSSSNSSSPSVAVDENATYQEYFGEQRYNDQGNPVYEPLLIGDSVAAGAVDCFYRAFPFGYIDAKVKRNVWENTYEDYLNDGVVGNYVVISLGTNDIMNELQIDRDLLGQVSSDKHVFLVNIRNTQEWVTHTNEVINRAPERHPNVTVVDWYGASEGHDEYFIGDGTHLTDEGAVAYIELIQQTILDTDFAGDPPPETDYGIETSAD